MGMIAHVISSSVTVTRPGGPSTTSTISVSTCGVGADDRFLLRAGVFAALGCALLTADRYIDVRNSRQAYYRTRLVIEYVIAKMA
jgi:hypothetical protein